MDNLIEQLTSLDNTQIKELRTRLSGLWGVSADVATTPINMEPVAITNVEQTEFSVFLTGFAADRKMGVIKMVREITGLPLLESKTLVETSPTGPKELKSNISKDDAADMKSKIEALGGVVEVK